MLFTDSSLAWVVIVGLEPEALMTASSLGLDTPALQLLATSRPRSRSSMKSN
jgi:hypothetical protein